MANDKTDLTTAVHTEISIRNDDDAVGTHSVHLLAEQTTSDNSSPEQIPPWTSMLKRCIPDRNTLSGRLLYTLLLIALIVLLETIPISDYAIVKSIKQDIQLLLGNSTHSQTSNEQ
jgi:hypothetical protein